MTDAFEVNPPVMAAGSAAGMGLRDALRLAEERFVAARVLSPRVDAELLAAHVLKLDRGQLLAAAFADRTVPQAFWDLVEQREQRVPVQHLTGRVWFRRLPLAVGPGVFVPRMETEDVAGAAIAAAGVVESAGERPVVVDLCTGSGAIALAVADEVATAEVTAVELDPVAASWAAHNIERLDSGRRVALEVGDAHEGAAELLGRAHVVVSNPPYIPPGMVPVDPEVAEHDPELALFGGGEDGLDVPRAVIARAWDLLRPGGVFVMEHADTQQEALVAYLGSRGWSDAVGHEDLAGRPRYVTAVRGASEGH